MSPPVVYRLWSSCIHRPSLFQLPGVVAWPARAMVRPTTDFAPPSRSARLHSSRAAPAVITSSSSRIRKLSTRCPFPSAKAPRTAIQRCSSVTMFFRTTRVPAGARDAAALEQSHPRPSSQLAPAATWASRSASHFPSGSISSCFSSTIPRASAPSYSR